MGKKYIILLCFALITRVFSQTTVADTTVVADSSYKSIIYEKAYKTASKDKRIKDDEKAMLKSLQHSLNLSKYAVNSIENRISFHQKNILDQSGRWPLVLQNIGWGAGLYGWGIPYTLNINDPKWYVASELFSFTASLYLTYRYTNHMNIPHSRAQMMRVGSLIGYNYGYDLGKLLKLDNDNDNEFRTNLGLMMASVPLGIWVGDKLNSKWQPTNGQAWAISLATLLGINTASNFHYILSDRPKEPEFYYDYEDGYYFDPDQARKFKQYEENLKEWEQMHAVFNMVSYPISLYLGNKFYGEKDYTFGDAIILYQGFGVGVVYSLMLSDVLLSRNIEDNNVIFRIALTAGGFVGTAVYDRMLLGKDYSFGES